MNIKSKSNFVVKIFLVLVVIVFMTTSMYFSMHSVYAGGVKQNGYTINDIEQYIDSIISWKQESLNAKSQQTLITEGLPKHAGTGSSEWYFISLKRYETGNWNNLSGKEYISALNGYIENSTSENNVPTDMQRIALAYAAAGENQEFINKIIEEQTGKLGIMSYIYGLILMDTVEYKDSKEDNSGIGITRNNIIDDIQSLRLEDGGWALAGKVSDIDITAMVIQALANYYDDDNIKIIIDEALSMLSARQLDTGDYRSWGARSAESACQVIMALCSLNIDCRNDERFIKNGNNLIDGIMYYRLSDGSFCHNLDSKMSNGKTTEQCLATFVSLWRMEKSLSSFYDFSAKTVPYPGDENSRNENQGNSDNDLHNENQTNYKFILYISIIVIGLIGIAAVIIKRLHGNIWSQIFIVFIVTVMALSGVYFVNIQTVDEYYLIHIDDIKEESETVFISINCVTAADKIYSPDDNIYNNVLKEYIPEEGRILESKEYVLRQEDTVFDILERAVRHNRIQMEYSGAKNNSLNAIYIKGLNHLYQFDIGSMSGWIYKVNGEFVSTSCSDYKLKNNDIIEWVYTCDLGEDVGALTT